MDGRRAARRGSMARSFALDVSPSAPGADAQFIWSSNLMPDNLVLVRKTFD